MIHPPPSTILALLGLLGVPLGVPPAAAQTVRGQVVDSHSRLPMSGAFAVLLDSAGTERDRALTDHDGRFVLTAPQPGVHRVEIRLIGLQKLRSDPLTLPANGVVERRWEMLPVAAILPPLVVEETTSCALNLGKLSNALWEQVHEVLTTVTWTARQPYRFETHRYRRDLGDNARRVLSEESWTASGVAAHPFRAVPADQLVTTGFMVEDAEGNSTYYAPDAETMLHPAFLETHCFGLREGAGGALVGITFEPVRGRQVPEVAGTLWLDRQTLELHRLEYRYAHLPHGGRDRRAGGRVDFLTLPDGARIVERWSILMPKVTTVVYSDIGRSSERRIVGFLEEGGAVVRAAHPGGTVVHEAAFARLDGSVTDSSATPPRPLARAAVVLEGGETVALTDGLGRFAASGQWKGEYGVTFRHPLLDTLGYTPRPAAVTLEFGVRSAVLLSIPPESQPLRRHCDDGITTETRVLVGVVRDGSDGAPVPGADVQVTWQPPAAEGPIAAGTTWVAAARADSLGAFTVCDNRWLDRTLTLTASKGERRGTAPPLRFSATPHGVTVGDGAFHPTPRRFWKQDVVVED